MDDFSSDRSSNDVIKKQKTMRIDALSARLASSRSCVGSVSRHTMINETLCIECGEATDASLGAVCQSCTSGTAPTPSAPLNAICCTCNTQISNMNTVRCCSSCKKYIHRDCDHMDSSVDDYVCHICRRSPLVGDVMLPAPGPASPHASVSSQMDTGPSVPTSLDDFASRSSPGTDMNDLYQLPTQHHVSEEISNGIASPATTTDSARNSPTFYPEKSPSDDEDEFKPPGYTRGGGRGRGGGKKKPSGRGASSVRTRSGGMPPTGVYADKLGQSTRGKRGKGSRGGTYKQNGKGKGTRGRRGRGQLAVTATSTVMQHLQSMAYSAVREVDRQMIEERERDEAKQRPDEVEYVRTVVVCDAADKFLEKALLCLVCGGVGKGEECSFVACSNCAQSYHTYCVGLHDKMRSTIVELGWRCLDCTVCEGCGEGKDESKLLLCEECDTSYHIYCLNPPLQSIPSGPWRCRWCSRCRRCNIPVTNGSDLCREGLCTACYSLRKCPKCTKLYQLGDQIIRCSACTKWYHGRCEGLYTTEDMEAAAANKMRCSSCRPQGRLNAMQGDGSGSIIVVDNVVLHQDADEILQSKYMPQNFQRNSFGAYGDYNSGSFDHFMSFDDDALQDEINEMSSGRGRMRGPGRRVPKMGVGGFSVRVPRARLLTTEEENETEDGTKKIKRPRKPRKSQMEELYPPPIQEAFFGGKAVEGKMLLDIVMDEPVLRVVGPGTRAFGMNSEGNQLSYEATEALKNDLTENDMLENFDVADYNIDDMEDFDLSQLMDDDDLDDLDNDLNGDLNDAFAFVQQDGFDPGASRSEDNNSLSQPSTSSGQCAPSRGYPMMQEERMTTTPYNCMIPSVPGSLSRSSSQMEGNTVEKNVTNPATERWEEDEPLGEKSTKAAVLYVNCEHPRLKEQYPDWNDRVKQIQKLWRQLDVQNRQIFVTRARENRQLRGKVPRMRRIVPGSQSSSVDSPTIQSPAPEGGALFAAQQQQRQQLMVQQSQMMNSDFKVPIMPVNGVPMMGTPSIPGTPQVGGPPYQQSVAGMSGDFPGEQIPTPLVPSTMAPRSAMSHLLPEQMHQYHILSERKKDLQNEQEHIELDLQRMRKQKKNLAAKRRQIVKSAESENSVSRQSDLNEADQAQLLDLTEKIPIRQKELETCKREVKAHQATVLEFEQKNAAPDPAIAGAMRMQHGQQMGSGPGRPGYPMQGHAMYPIGHPAYQQMRVPQQMPYGMMMGGQPMETNGMHTRMIPQFSRSPSLGGGRFIFDRLQSQLEREVYECVDFMISTVSYDCDREQHFARESGMLKRLLDPTSSMMHMGHGQPGPSQYMSDIVEQPQRKKKRAQAKKAGTGGSSNEYEQLVDKLQLNLKVCEKLPRRACESSRAHMTMLPEHGITGLPLKIEQKPLIGERVSMMKMSFMDDFYAEEGEISGIPRKTQSPDPTMGTIAPHADIESLKDCEPCCDEFVMDEIDSSAGCSSWDIVKGICNAVDRRPLESQLRLTIRLPETDIPADPTRHVFAQKIADPEELACSLVVKEEELNSLLDEIATTSHTSTDSVRLLIDRLKDITGIKAEVEYSIDTPPMSPKDNDFLHGVPINQDNPHQPCMAGGKCRACDMIMESAIVQQSMCKLGLTPPEEGKDDTVYFCSMKCYYSFVASSKVALSNDQLIVAENHADEETLSKLRQISADHFAKSIQGKVTLQHASAPLLADSLLSPKDLKALEGRREYVKEIRASDLTALMDPSGKCNGSDSSKDGVGAVKEWTIFDQHVLRTFLRIQENKKELAFCPKMGIEPFTYEEDTRKCVLCGVVGDADPTQIQGRLLNVDASIWVHVNCAIWSSEVYENPNGGLTKVDAAVSRAVVTVCHLCGGYGASIQCHKIECASNFHLPCARRIGGKFLKDRTFICPQHQDLIQEVIVHNLSTIRRVYVERDENLLLSRLFDHNDIRKLCLRLGSLVFHSVGQMLPEHLKDFHNSNFIFPKGYRITRLFWHPMDPRKRVSYECTIREKEGKPWFIVSLDGKEIGGPSANEAWRPVVDHVKMGRDKMNAIKFFPNQIAGETLFGLNESAISKITESLPGVDTLYTYTFRHGGNPVLELPLAENPSGCARCEPRCRTLIKKHRSRPMPCAGPSSTSKTSTSSSEGRTRGEGRVRSTYDQELAAAQMQRVLSASGIGAEWASYVGKFCVEPLNNAQMYSAYQKMRKEWRNTVYLARSKIQGLGLYAQRDIDMSSMIIEYKGELIRSEVGEMREKRYMAQNRGVYMFRLDEELIVDASMAGGCARYINHSCDPNCSTRIIQSGSLPEDKKIIITANRPIKAHEELTYDYQFELEEDTKIPCLCGAPNCQKWMN